MQTRGGVQMFDVSSLKPLAVLVRRNIPAPYIQELAFAIKEQGLLNPVTIRYVDGGYQVIAGYCRLEAHKFLGRDKIPGILVEATDAEAYEKAAVENLQRLELDPLEEALSLKLMMDSGKYSLSSLAKSIAKSTSWVRTRMDTLLWPKNFLSALGEKQLSMSALSELAAIDNKGYRDYLLKQAISNGVTATVCRMWRTEWDLTQIMLPEEELPLDTPKIDAQPARILMDCWGCQKEKPAGDITYEPLCSECILLLKKGRLNSSH